MKKILPIMILVIILHSCNSEMKNNTVENPFIAQVETLYGIPPFNEITYADYIPAFNAGFKDHLQEIEAIINNAEAPNFRNTIEAFERSGEILNKVSSVFYNLNGSLTNDTMQQIAREIAPLMSRHNDDITLNQKLFNRIESVYLQQEGIDYTPEQSMLLEKTYKRFIRGGAKLNEDAKEKMRKINEELSLLSLQFGENVLAETNNFQLFIENPEQLSGIPQSAVSAAAKAATDAGQDGKWLFTLHMPSLIPVLQHADDRTIREKVYKAYISRCDKNDEFDNKKIVSRTVQLRAERAALLGYADHASFVLEQNMAGNPKTVNQFLEELAADAMPMAEKEARRLQELIDKQNSGIKLEAWDWWYYAEILRKEKFDLDENELRPYFKLESVRDGAFKLANKLWGLEFRANESLPKYQKDVETYEVYEANGTFVGILFMDFFPRPSKRGGAWMSAFRKQSQTPEGERITPVITTNFNFTAPIGNQPALLSWDEVSTLFHEFGHALHGLLANTVYNSLSGTSVPRDFVELPSQIMENWAPEPDVLALFAFHHETGEPIPAELTEKMKKSGTFNQGFAMAEFLAAAMLDMDYHTVPAGTQIQVDEFERSSIAKSGLIPEIALRYRSTYFSHIFSGGYSSGYYSYIWSEVLDADAFEAFKEKGLFDQETARKFRKYILEKGGTEDPAALYVAFRGHEPNKEALLRKRGLR